MRSTIDVTGDVAIVIDEEESEEKTESGSGPAYMASVHIASHPTCS